MRGLWHGAAVGMAVIATLGMQHVAAPPAASHHGVDNMFKNSGDADCGPSGSHVCRADNLTHTYYYQSFSSRLTNATESAMTSMGYYTDINVSKESSLSYLETDMYLWIDNSLPAGIWGNVDCLSEVNYLRCRAYNVRIDPVLNDGTVGYNATKALVCHEVGHTVGLLHGVDAVPAQGNGDNDLGCMVTPIEGALRTLGAHNNQQINAAY